jgi:hypothetical protein
MQTSAKAFQINNRRVCCGASPHLHLTQVQVNETEGTTRQNLCFQMSPTPAWKIKNLPKTGDSSLETSMLRKRTGS